MRFQVLSLMSMLGLASAKLTPNHTSTAGVEIYNPGNFFETTGPWSLMSKAGDFLYIAGMRGIYTQNSTLAPVGEQRIRLAFENMATLAKWMGAELDDCVRIVVYVTDMYRYRPIANQVQIDLWGNDENTYPPRTIIEVDRLNDDDIIEVEGTFYCPAKTCNKKKA
ncbi:YjgF-like protein [Xylariaceae sp. FL1272]|nr:YjgF-like protein [Xylariaceae sp. FL1272]